jgi:hypothetical protein
VVTRVSIWQDDDLLASLKEALREADIVPPRFVDLGKVVYRPTYRPPLRTTASSVPFREGSAVSPPPD